MPYIHFLTKLQSFSDCQSGSLITEFQMLNSTLQRLW